MIETEEINYGPFQGYLAYNDDSHSAKPGILIAHAWRGHDEFVREKAEALAELGYVAFAADVYGKGILAENNEEAAKLMIPLFIDRKELQSRITAALNVLKSRKEVDATKTGAIGFCFGGLTVLELLRSGADIKGAVSFHGVLGDVMGDIMAVRTPLSKIKGSMLFLHGYNDPLVSSNDIKSIQEELTIAGVDWQMHIYGGTYHAFTNPIANEKELGLVYNSRSEARSWIAMNNFFDEVFSK